MRTFISMTFRNICDVHLQVILNLYDTFGGSLSHGHMLLQNFWGGTEISRAMPDKGGHVQVRAKAIRKYVDKMIQLAKEGSLHSRRQV